MNEQNQGVIRQWFTVLSKQITNWKFKRSRGTFWMATNRPRKADQAKTFTCHKKLMLSPCGTFRVYFLHRYNELLNEMQTNDIYCRLSNWVIAVDESKFCFFSFSQLILSSLGSFLHNRNYSVILFELKWQYSSQFQMLLNLLRLLSRKSHLLWRLDLFYAWGGL